MRHQGTVLPRHDWVIAGRLVHPVAFGVSILMATLVFYNYADRGELGATLLGDVVLVLAGTSLVSLVVGWWSQWELAVRIGLLSAFAAYTVRLVFLMLLYGPGQQGVWLSTGAAVITGGSYLLETWHRSDGDD